MPSLPGDLRFGARMLAKNPGFTLTAIAVLALGIGANVAIFTVASALLLRPLPYQAPQRLVSLSVKDKTTDFGGTLLRYEMLRDRSQSFQSIAAWADDNLNLTGGSEPQQVPVARVTSNFFSTLGVQPQLGRAFTQVEGSPEGATVAIISDSLWRSRFGGNLNIAGQTVTLDGVAYAVVGVLPAEIQFPFITQTDIWIPRYFELSLMTPQRLRMGVGYLNYLARLKPGVALDGAASELAVLNEQYRKQNSTMPDADPGIVTTVAPLSDLVVENVRTKVLGLSFAVALVLLLACANVASLLLSRALSRKREIAVRIALGASRVAVVRQLLIESLLMALIAGLLGIGLGWAATRALTRWALLSFRRESRSALTFAFCFSRSPFLCLQGSSSAQRRLGCSPGSIPTRRFVLRVEALPVVVPARASVVRSWLARWQSRCCCWWQRDCCCRALRNCCASTPVSTPTTC